MFRRIKQLIELILIKMAKIDDTPHKISLGLAIGVASGIIPGTGPLAALVLAFLLHANRISALIGSITVNTWFSIVTIVPAIKIGALLFNLNWSNLYKEYLEILSYLKLKDILKLSIYKIILPIVIGYVIIALVTAIVLYIISMFSIFIYRRWK